MLTRNATTSPYEDAAALMAPAAAGPAADPLRDSLQDPLYEDSAAVARALAPAEAAPAPLAQARAPEAVAPPAAAAPAARALPALGGGGKGIEANGAPIPLPDHYRGEDYLAAFRGNGGLILGADGEITGRSRTKYLADETERLPHRAAAGLDGRLLGAGYAPVDTTDAGRSTLKGRGDGRHLYTLGAGGDLMTMPADHDASVQKLGDRDHTVMSYTNHSTMRAGGAVAGAGDLTVKDGWVKDLSNASGHYQPDEAHLLHTVDTLHAQGLNLDAATVTSWHPRAGAKSQPAGPYRESRANHDLLDQRAEVLADIRRRRDDT